MANEQQQMEEIYREEWGRIVATLIRLLSSFDPGEEAAQEAFAVALAEWPRREVPTSPHREALALASHDAERRFLSRRLAEIEAKPDSSPERSPSTA